MQTLLVRQALFLTALIALLGFLDWGQRASADIRLSLADGQRLTVDQIGPETDARVLAARVQKTGIVMTRKIPWSKIIAVQIDEQPIAIEELQARYADTTVGTTRTEPARRQERPAAAHSDTRARPVNAREIAWSHRNISVGLPQQFAPQPCFVPSYLPPFGGPPGFAGIPVESRVIGVRRDPFSAYPVAAARRFPYGIPISEAGFAADLLRAEAAAETLAPYAFPPLGAGGAPLVLPLPRVPAEAVRSIAVEARAASSQGNVDWDVLEIAVQALDASG